MPLPEFRRSFIFCAAIVLFCAQCLGAGIGPVQIIRIPGANQIVKAQLDAAGVIHVLYDADDSPFYRRSTNQGATFSEPVPVVDPASLKPGLKFHAWDLAVGRESKVHVAMGNNAWKLKLPQEEWSLHYATLDAREKTFSQVRNLNRKPSEGFSLAADNSGDVIAAFLSGKLYKMESHDGGRTFDAWKELDPGWNPCDCCTTALACGSDGNIALLYREETNNERDVYVVLWNKEKQSFKRRRISTTPWKIEGCPMTYFSISPVPGGYVAAWPTKGEIYFARLDSNGNFLPPGEIKTPGKNGMRTGIVALGGKDGSTLIAWKNAETLNWQLYETSGRAAAGNSGAGSTESTGNGAAGVVLQDGRYLLFP
jgi:hypothetical protein